MIRRPPRSTLSLHDALPISPLLAKEAVTVDHISRGRLEFGLGAGWFVPEHEMFGIPFPENAELVGRLDRKSTRLNSSHANISYAVFCLKKKKKIHIPLSSLH